VSLLDIASSMNGKVILAAQVVGFFSNPEGQLLFRVRLHRLEKCAIERTCHRAAQGVDVLAGANRS